MSTRYYRNGASFYTDGGVVTFNGYLNTTTFPAGIASGALRRPVVRSVAFTPIPG